MEIIHNDIKKLISETITSNNLEIKTFDELIEMDIIEYIYIILSEIHKIDYNLIEKTIIEKLKEYINQYQVISKNNSPSSSNYYIETNTDLNLELSEDSELDLDSFSEIKINIDKKNINQNKNKSGCINKNNIQNLDSFINIDIGDIRQRLKNLQDIILPEQRSQEWYQMRNNMITASDLYKVIGTKGIRRELIIKKCSPIDPNKKVGGGDACKHGIKFEQIATNLYELRNNVKILEFGCIPHPDNSFPFGASPDGICSQDNELFAGRMLEIKCPYSRVINGIVPEMYWKQVQGQLEVCNLEFCDFLECKIVQYDGEDEFYLDGDEYLTNEQMEKGAIVVYSDQNNNFKYKYAPIGLDRANLKEWLSVEIDLILDDNNLNFIEISWWKLLVYSCVLIKRDRNWFNEIRPKIEQFWEEVEYYRKSGVEKLIAEKRPRKKKNVKDVYSTCLIDSDNE